MTLAHDLDECRKAIADAKGELLRCIEPIIMPYAPLILAVGWILAFVLCVALVLGIRP